MTRTSTRSRRKPTASAAAGTSPSFWMVLLCLLPFIVLLWFLVHLEGSRDEVRPVEVPQRQYPPGVDVRKPAAGQRPSPPGSPAKEDGKPRPEPMPTKSEIARANSALRGNVPKARPHYFLQAGAFRKKSDAERLRARLALLGQVTRLEQGKVGQKTWHRVMIGPFADERQRAQMQSQLNRQGFKQLLRKERPSG